MILTMPPRARYLPDPARAEELRPLPFDPALADWLPTEVTALTGAIRTITLPEQGVCNLLLLLEAELGTFVLKVARGDYRSQELWAEHTVMQALSAGPVPVPCSFIFARRGNLGFQLRAYSPGQPLSTVLEADETVRPDAIRQMGETLAAIHAVRPGGRWTWEEWVDASLKQATLNLAAWVCDDPEEFTPDRPPKAVLKWLGEHRPTGAGSVCLLHGDFRPKNLLWQAGRLVSVIDWAFVDIGDPYYDLSIFRWYMRDEAEWQQFLSAYGASALDQQRFDYCLALHKFLNV